ncbi:MAG: glycosyltransferase [Planctomycetia bacterium]|nr:glycosyltransferase [Planctomycetia bacterium]
MAPRPPLRVVSAPVPDGDSRQLILVAVLTFRRSRELAEFLEGYSRVELPPDADVTLLVVDNDAQGSGRATVDAYRDRIPGTQYVVEPRVGIPVARNRALREALASNANAVCFIDDDEVPEPDWLVNLAGEWRRSGAELVGGPVGVSPTPPTATIWQRLVNASLASRSRRKYAGTATAAASGGHYTIVTNNWLCDLRWLAASGLMFDERLLLTGGSDTAFCRAAIAAGCRCSWAPDAVVHEMIPPDRLTLRYQFWRGASQSITHFRMKHDRITTTVVATTAAMSVVRTVAGLALLAIPLFGIGSLTIAARSLGWAAGRLQALCGAESTLYAYAATTDSQTEISAFPAPIGQTGGTLRRAA